MTLPTRADYSPVPKETNVEEWTSWDEDAPTSVKNEGGNGDVATQQNFLKYCNLFQDPDTSLSKTQKRVIKKIESLNFGISNGSTGFSSKLVSTQDMPFIHQSFRIQNAIQPHNLKYEISFNPLIQQYFDYEPPRIIHNSFPIMFSFLEENLFILCSILL